MLKSLKAANSLTLTSSVRFRALLFATIAVLGCAVDLATKHWIFGRLGMPFQSPSQWLWTDVFGFTTSLNEGALFGMGQGQVAIFAALSLAAAVGIVAWLWVGGALEETSLTVALGMVMAGILGNLYDRLGLPGLVWNFADQRGLHQVGDPVYAVRDWLHFKVDAVGLDWPIFNIADSLLVCGAGLLCWYALRAELKPQAAAQSHAAN